MEDEDMFEDATFDARGAVRNYASRWMMLTAAANAAVVAGLIVAPLLSSRSLPAFLAVVRPPVYAPQPEPVKIPDRALPQSWARPVIAMPMNTTATRIVTRPIDAAAGASNTPWDPDPFGTNTGNRAGTPDGISVFGSASGQVVKQATQAVTRVSSGVVEGLLLSHAVPTYPPIAKSVGIGGEVVLAAVISTEGRVENLRVVSGHPLLREGALEAVREWRYRPYLLNGKAVEVETTITIRFSLSGR